MANLETLDVSVSAQAFPEEELRDKVVVVIDVLRATSTMVTALMNGAKGVIPVADMGEASRISQSVDSKNLLLCGEKDGVKIEGYDLGNSPLEYEAEVVKDKTLIFNTTNGTKTIKKAVGAKKLYIASFLNLSTVVNTLKNEKSDIILACAGWHGRLALEDMILAGNIVYNLSGGTLVEDGRDAAKVAFGLYEKYHDDIPSVLGKSNHAVRLQGITGESDIDYCSRVDICEFLPILHEGIITIDYGKKEK